MLPRHIRLSLLVAQLVAVATLIRSIAYDRWITVLASVLLIGGVMAARRGRTWGVGLAFAAAAAFPVAWAIGIAPAWFCLVGIAGSLPFALTSRAFARFDKQATVLLAVLAAAGGALGSFIWKEVAYSVFTSVPALTPSADAQHGFVIGTLVMIATAITLSRAGRANAKALADDHRTHVRVAQRIGDFEASDAASTNAMAEEEVEEALQRGPSQQRAHR